MADKSMRINMIMGMVDKITRPARAATTQTAKMGEQITATQAQLNKLGNTSKDIEHFQNLSRAASKTGESLQQAKQRVEGLQAEMKSGSAETRKLRKQFEEADRQVWELSNQLKSANGPTEALTYQFKRAQAEADRFSKELKASETSSRKMARELTTTEKKIKSLTDVQARENSELSEMSEKLKTAGVSTTKLNEATRKIKEQTASYNESLEQQHAALAKVTGQQEHLSKITERNKKMRMSATVDAVGVGAAVYGIKKLVNAYGEVSSAQGEISSLGISSAGVDEITKKARDFSNQWSGTTQADFIKASYDIKSGIASLSDSAVGEFTRIAAMTAGATKSSVDQMTGLFASGYGIYRKQFDQFGGEVITGWNTLSNSERDAKFGEFFSAGIASAVQAFKTDGSQMSAAISNLGAAATSANVSFAEQLSILGTLQATMSGGEAATKYRAFLTNAAKAGDALNLSFLDVNNNLRSMPEILEELRGKYGDTIDALEEQEMKKAFGTDEAIGMIKLLYPEVDALKSSITGMNESLRGGMATTDEMARKILEGPNESLARLSSRVLNMTAALGYLFAPAVMFVADRIGDLAIGLATFSEQFPLLSQVIAFAIVGLVGLKAASIAGRFAFSYLSDGFVIARKMLLFFTASNLKANASLAATRIRALAAGASVLYMSGLQKAAAIGARAMAVAQWALNAAMTANPIGLVIVAVAALIGLAAWLIKDWGGIGDFFLGIWEGIKNGFFWAWEMIKFALSFTPLGLVLQAWEPLLGFFGELWGKISGVFSGAMDWIKSVILSPISAIKDMLGGAWDSIFGGDSGVDINSAVSHQVEGGAMVAATTPSIAAASSVSSNKSQVSQYGDIVIHAAPGMDTTDLARLVAIELDKREKQNAAKMRGLLYD